MNRLVMFAFGAAAIGFTLTACDRVPTGPAPVVFTTSGSATSSVSVQGSAPAGVGASAQFTAMATLADGTTRDVTNLALWRSSDTAVATVNPEGLVTAVNTGGVGITASYAGGLGRLPVLINGFGSPGYFAYISDADDPLGLGTSGVSRSVSLSISPLNSLAPSRMTIQGSFTNPGAFFPYGQGWQLVVEAPVGVILGESVFLNPGPWPDQPEGRPGMRFLFGRSSFAITRTCRLATGRFEFVEYSWRQQNSIDHLHVTFELRCEGATGSLRGIVRIR